MLHPSHFDDKLNTSNFIAEISIAHSIRKCYKELNISKRKRITIHQTQGSYPRITAKNEHRYPPILIQINMKSLTTLLIAMSMLLSSFALHAQRTTEFFYLGNVYCKTKTGVEQRFPYLPVYLSLQDKPNGIIAVTMTNANGEASFKGVPIDPYKYHILSVHLPSGTYRFLRTPIEKNPGFKDYISTHIQLDAMEKYLTVSTITPKKEDSDKLALDLATSAIKGAHRKGVTISDVEGLNYKLFVSGRMVQDKKLADVLLKVTGEMLDKIVITHPTQANDYYAGSIDFMIRDIPIQKVGPTTFTLERL